MELTLPCKLIELATVSFVQMIKREMCASQPTILP